VLERLKGGQQFLDLGCGFGQNIRKLVYDGAPAENVSGADISQTLVDCGYEYFKDQEKLKSKFIIGDVFASDSSAFFEAKGNFDIVFASMVYHLWGWDDQIKACVETIKLLRPVPGSVLFGWQLGATPAGEIERMNSMAKRHKMMYQHDEESWRRMWKEIENQTGTKWDVEVRSVVTPELKGRHGVSTREGSTLSAVFFTMIRL
jgi:SAM-dependent methyltransferase